MLSTQFPKQINYSSIIPKGFPSVYKQWDLDPITNNKNWANNDIVRFNFMNVGKGVFDPFRSYIQITVSTNANDHPVGLLQIDNSAQSYINQTVLYSNNKQIERITQYSVIAAYLNDIGLNQIISEGREAQGYGYGSYDTMPQTRPFGSPSEALRKGAGSVPVFTCSTGNIFPTIGNFYPDQLYQPQQATMFTGAKLSKGHVTNCNPVMTNDVNIEGGTQTCIQAAIQKTGYGNNIRGEYLSNFISPKFPQSTQSIPNFALKINSEISNGTYPFYYNAQIPYYTSVDSTMTQLMYFDDGSYNNTHAITCNNFGYTSLYSPFFSRGSFEPFISATVPQCSMLNGYITPTKTPIYRRKFKIPLISGVMGVLIDPSQFILIPLKSINDCLLQITLDQYAMFTSGYSDVSELDNVGMQYQQKRNYQIERIKYKLQTYHFIDSQIEMLLQSSLNKEIILTTNFWQLGNQYQISGGTPVNNNYIIGLNSPYLNQIVCLFVPNDYQYCSFARKHFRISNNVKKYWSKVAVDYWPPQPYKGNGGNVMSNNDQDDNSNFIENIYWSNDYMFSKTPLPRINQFNFAINDRIYNVNNKNTFYDPALLNNINYSFTNSSVNGDTALGLTWIHENRYIGKAAYVISYTPFSNQDHVLQGINISGTSNFEVLFEQDANQTFPRDQTLYVFGKSSVIVKYTKNGIQTFGR